MARLTGPPPFVGTHFGITIYEMWGEYFMRSKSSLTGKRVKKDKAFKRTMEYAGLMARASRIGAAVYKLLPAARKKHTLYKRMTGIALKSLKQGKERLEIERLLIKKYVVQKGKRKRIVDARYRIRDTRHGVPNTRCGLACSKGVPSDRSFGENRINDAKNRIRLISAYRPRSPDVNMEIYFVSG
jgi:hypothetical protein